MEVFEKEQISKDMHVKAPQTLLQVKKLIDNSPDKLRHTRAVAYSVD